MSSPNTSNSDHPTSILTQFLDKHQGVVIIKLYWYACDGFPYSRTVTSNRCRSIAEQNGGLTVHVSSIGGLANAQALDPAFASPVGKTTLLPDWVSLRLLSGSHAIVQCKIFEKLKLYPGLMMQSPTQRCPRSCLERVLQIAEDSYGIKLLAGFETEFYLLRSTPRQDNIYNTGAYHSLLGAKDPFPLWSSASCMRGLMAKCVEEYMIALEGAGIVVEQGHAESSSNQFEIPTGPLPVLEAVDAVMCTREIITDTATRHGFRAIFIPKPFPDLRPTVLHLHLSIHPLHENALPSGGAVKKADDVLGHEELNTTMPPAEDHFSAEAFSQKVDSFLAGILQRHVALCAFSRPSWNSCLPSPAPSTTGDFVAWGLKNSSVPLNEVSSGHWEIRSLDWTANIYLAVAAYVTAGLMGIKCKEKLRWKDPMTLVDRLGAKEREALGIVEAMPTSFEAAFERLIESEYAGLAEFMGEEILDLFVIVKMKGEEFVKSLTEQERMELFLLHF